MNGFFTPTHSYPTAQDAQTTSGLDADFYDEMHARLRFGWIPLIVYHFASRFVTATTMLRLKRAVAEWGTDKKVRHIYRLWPLWARAVAESARRYDEPHIHPDRYASLSPDTVSQLTFF